MIQTEDSSFNFWIYLHKLPRSRSISRKNVAYFFIYYVIKQKIIKSFFNVLFAILLRIIRQIAIIFLEYDILEMKLGDYENIRIFKKI